MRDVLGTDSSSRLLGQPCCSNSLAGPSQYVGPSEKEIKKKRVRRRYRPKRKAAKSVDETEFIQKSAEENTAYDCSILLQYLTISPVKSGIHGQVIHVRDRKRKRIKINSFLNCSTPVVFISKPFKESQKISSIADDVQNLSIKKEASSKKVKKSGAQKRIERRQNKVMSEKDMLNKSNSTKESQPSKQRKQNKSILEKKPHPFKEYISEELVNAGLEDGTLIRGIIRINPKNHREAYVSNEDRTLEDYYICGMEDRNRALEGDEVVLELKSQSEWKDGKTTASVVYIKKRVHPRVAVGHLKLMPDKNTKFATFSPRDSRVPRIRVPSICWPPNFYRCSDGYANTLFLATITEWQDARFAVGFITATVGISGDLVAETNAILMENQLDVAPYTADVNKYFKNFDAVSEDEFVYREDVRDECVFTIDPESARDLDDALSCKELDNGNLKIGVHISDVAFYFDEGSELDEIVKRKATTVYLVNSTYHMLPLELCMKCSLLPGEEKRAFSVFWEMTKDGDIVHTYFTRTIVKSCAKLAYEHAQLMIENPSRDFSNDNLPEIHCGYQPSDLNWVVQHLYRISKNLREKRFNSGALRIDQPKLSFTLDPETGEPNSWKIYEIKDAHRMIEEFMLLANISVAEKIKATFPDLAFLRHHEPPVLRMLKENQASLEASGIFIDISSSKGIQSTLWKYSTDDFLGQARMAVLNHLFAKPMKRANYFCAANNPNEEFYWHYALHIPLYTHFTSPIRRYADIMVHRLLAASLGYEEKPNWESSSVSRIAENCNVQKYNAKKAGDASMDLFLAHFIEKNPPFVQKAVVADVREKSFEIIVISTGTTIRLFTSDFEPGVQSNVVQVDLKDETKKDDDKIERKIWKIEVVFPEDEHCPFPVTFVIERFAIVNVELTRKDKTNKLDAKLLRPLQSFVFEKKIN